MKSIGIIGAGITGLTAAFYLRRKGFEVTVYEASDRVGGVIQSARHDGFLAEFGPNTILETSPLVRQLITDAGLEGRRLYPDPRAEARYVVRGGRPVAMPGSPLGFFTTPLFSARAKLALLREPFVPPRREGPEESVAQFVRRRLGQEFLERAIDALVAGVYAGDPEKLSVPHAFPKLGQLEARYGSLIKGQILGAKDRRKRGDVAKDRAPKFSFDEGLQVLPDTLSRSLGDAVRLNAAVSSLRSAEDGWWLALQGRGQIAEFKHDALVYAGTAFGLARLQIETFESGSIGAKNQTARTPELKTFAEIRYPPVASVVLGFRRQDIAHPCLGFGMLIPKIEGFKILGTIFSSALFPNRAPAGHVLLSSYVGGERYPDLARLPEQKLVELTCEDLRGLIGATGRPVFQHTSFYPQAIPQYNVGYGRYREAMSQLEGSAPGLFLAGHYRDGVSLSDSIVSGCKVADRVEQFLGAREARPAEARVAA